MFSHRIPCLLSQNTSIRSSKLTIEVQTDNVELSKKSESLASNYQQHYCGVSAIYPTGATDLLTVGFPGDMISEDRRAITGVPFQFPSAVKFSRWYRFKKKWVWLALIWSTFFANTMIDHVLGGATDYKRIAASGVIAVLSAWGILRLGERTTSK